MDKWLNDFLATDTTAVLSTPIGMECLGMDGFQRAHEQIALTLSGKAGSKGRIVVLPWD